jgi:hypothetical protein
MARIIKENIPGVGMGILRKEITLKQFVMLFPNGFSKLASTGFSKLVSTVSKR